MPYMITVIPVYKDPDTGKIIHLKDKPELVGIFLRSMQDDGAKNYYAWLYSPIL